MYSFSCIIPRLIPTAATAVCLILTIAASGRADDGSPGILQIPGAVEIRSGWEIPSKGYCDQPYVVVLKDGTWVCTMTTGPRHEGQKGQHIVSTRSWDKGRSWEPLVDIEPADGPEASWVMPFLTEYGRIYAFYTYNADNLREVRAETEYARKRVDTLGVYAFRYSDDGARTWSDRRWIIPIRATEIDRANPYGGEVRFFWGVGKPIVHQESMILGFSKVGRFGADFLAETESWFLRSPNILTERDPNLLQWELLPEGERGLRAPAGPIAEEVNLTTLSDGSLFCTYRTVAGHPCHAYSRDGGRSWTPPAFMTYGPGKPLVEHPRAANFVRRLEAGPYAGRFIYWFHNHPGKGYDGRNPAFLLGGVEVDTPAGKAIDWGEPVAVLYAIDPNVRISYPDFIWDDGLYITETQKSIARVHRIPDELLAQVFKAHPVGASPQPPPVRFTYLDPGEFGTGGIPSGRFEGVAFGEALRAPLPADVPYLTFFTCKEVSGGIEIEQVQSRFNRISNTRPDTGRPLVIPETIEGKPVVSLG